MTSNVRIVIIGAGTAGLTALKEAQRYTDDVLLINEGPYGTTCARVGCMPSKALLAAAHGFHRRHFLSQAGVEGTDALSVDIAAVMRRVRALRDRFVSGPVKLAESLGERSRHGRPLFLEPDLIEIGGERIRAGAVIIATGTTPVIPDPWRALGERVVTSDTVFELERPGRRLAVVGLGAIGVELGQAFAHLGLDVHGFTRGETVAGISDPGVNEAVIASLRQSMLVTTGADVDLSPAADGAVRVTAGRETLDVDWVLASLGRRPNLQDMGLEEVGILDPNGNVTGFDPLTLRVGDLPVYVAGDVSGQRPLMHEAADEGRIAAYHALNPDAECLSRRAPLGIVFTEPNIARVGLSHAKLPEDGVVIGEADFTRQARAVMNGDNEGVLRVYVDAADGRLLGSELAVPAGEHLAHQLAWAIQQGLTVDALLQMPVYHPVVEEGLRSALQDARRRIGTRRSIPDLPLCHEPADWALGGD